MKKLAFLRSFVAVLAFLTMASFFVGISNSHAARSAEEFKAEGQEKISEQTMPSTAADLGVKLPLWSCIPFVGILLSIAIMPMVAPVFWHHHFPKIALAWGLVFLIPFVMYFGGQGLYEVLHVMLGEYLPFIILLWGLFTVSGGIYIEGALAGTPRVNVVILSIGTVLASFMGTTGAAMLLIRPLIRANRDRSHKVHTVVFFIFLVANIGGLLTPLGDPPLFLGFLNGVPFFWTMKLWKEFAIASIALLAIYYAIDSLYYRKELKAGAIRATGSGSIRMRGESNFIYLLGIVGAVLFSGSVHIGEFSLAGIHFTYQSVFRDVMIVLMGILSLATTKRTYRDANGFTWFPIKEVAFLFAGIFLTIVAPLKILQAGEAGAARSIVELVNSPAAYFWVTGLLSSFLDNAPTYLTFFNLSLGDLGIAANQVHGILIHQISHPESQQFIAELAAISVGAVFFGANTYIGNAPNFMVRSIAEEFDVKMPSFFGYMVWSSAILIPLFVILSFIFF